MKWLKSKIWRLCCITFDDDNDDVLEPPHGENPIMDLEDDEEISMISETQAMTNVYDWIIRSDFEWYRFDDEKSSDDSYYPSSTTYTDSSRTKKSDSDDRQLCNKMKEINKDLKVLSKNLDKIAALEKLL